MWSPVEIRAWYSKWPTWARWLGFAFFALLLAVSTAIWFLRRPSKSDVPNDVVTSIKNEITQQLDANARKVEAIDKERAEVHAEDARVIEEMDAGDAKRKAQHRDLVSARNVREVDDLYERLRAAAKRRNNPTDN